MHWTDINTRVRDDVVVIDLRGHLTLADDDRRLMPTVARLLEQGHVRLLLNLQYLSQIDSTGVGEMVGVYTRVARLGGTVKLCAVHPRVQEILDATRLRPRVLPFRRRRHRADDPALSRISRLSCARTGRNFPRVSERY